MRVQQIANLFDSWAPKFIQWERDNTGLLVGKSQQEVTGVLLCLDVTSDALERAQKLKCNLVISHHPLIFFPMKKITPETDRTSDLIYKLIKNDTSLLSYHTNLDFTSDGVNHQTAKKLKISNIKFLKPISNKSLKLVTFVPKKDVGTLAEAIFGAGGGIIGNIQIAVLPLKERELSPVREIRIQQLVKNKNLKRLMKFDSKF
ncbi:MAG: Nif3-like dinuclear metal center hexameric protein [Ignavibacteriales bacterium]|nr:Nif3-like dinuclear metal center hexameric protein [Ignavibacteriales bacterium]